jgi:nitrate/nitrite-specific signal transduction histidine kinase
MIIIFLSIFIGTVLLFILIGFLIAKKITRPISNLKLGVEKIAQGDFDYKVISDSQDEIGDLAQAFNAMALAVKQSESEVDVKVKNQTKEIKESKDELRLKLAEIEKLNGFMMGREAKMIELKKKISELEKK